MNKVCAVMIPLFMPSDPSPLFTMLESTFELAVLKSITESKTKYNY